MEKEHNLCFAFIGGTHQLYHVVPVAAEISKQYPNISVSCLCTDAADEAALHEIASQMSADRMQVIRLPVPWSAKLAVRITGKKSAAKGTILASMRWKARHASAIIVPERTSSVLRKMGWRKPLIHFMHGAGDRALASDKRLGSFDHIVMFGEKDIQRAIKQGIDPDRLHLGRYVKLDYLRNTPPPADRLFPNDRPVVVYNPHFDRSVSSLNIARDVIETFRQQDRYNLVFAPHIRGVENLSAADRESFQSLAIDGKVIIDLGSANLFNMRYTRTADVYLGDISSQLYEFLSRPRPAVFINAHGVDWQDNPHYAGWHLGDVVERPAAIMAAIDHAIANHPQVTEAQASAVKFAFGEYEGAIKLGADLIIEALS